jgi:hypothetical protein
MSNKGEVHVREPQASLRAFMEKLLQERKDLPEDAARVLRENIWKLYDDPAVTREPQETPKDEYAACPLCGDPRPDHLPAECQPYVQKLKAETATLRSSLAAIQQEREKFHDDWFSEAKRCQALEARLQTLRPYARHKATCTTFDCINCGYNEFMHDLANDIDELSCTARAGGKFTPNSKCNCGLLALLGDPGSPDTETPK